MSTIVIFAKSANKVLSRLFAFYCPKIILIIKNLVTKKANAIIGFLRMIFFHYFYETIYQIRKITGVHKIKQICYFSKTSLPLDRSMFKKGDLLISPNMFNKSICYLHKLTWDKCGNSSVCIGATNQHVNTFDKNHLQKQKFPSPWFQKVYVFNFGMFEKFNY